MGMNTMETMQAAREAYETVMSRLATDPSDDAKQAAVVAAKALHKAQAAVYASRGHNRHPGVTRHAF